MGSLFVYTERIRYSYIVSSLTNTFLLLLFLSRNHFEFIPYRGFILAFTQLFVLLGFLIIFYVASQKFLAGRLVLTMKTFGTSISILSWPRQHGLKDYWLNILFLLPIIPFGGVIFVDHTILYADLLAMILENGISIVLLLLFSLFLYYSIYSSLSIIPNNEINTLTFNLSREFTNNISRKKFSFKSILRGIRSRIISIILLAGIISPFYILTVVSRTKIEIIVLFQTLIDISISIAQNPFFTFQRVVTNTRSNIPFIGNSTEVINNLFFLQQSQGNWNFLPDSFMSSSSDWIHGLLTVMLWFGIIVLNFYLLRRSKQYPLKAVLGVVLLIMMNFVWILLVMGLGSISEEGGSSGMPPLEDMSLLINFDMTIKEFLILPLGLLLFLIAALIILIQCFYRKKKQPIKIPMPLT